MHIRAALRNGLTREEVGEVLLQTAVYAACRRPTPRSRSRSGRWRRWTSPRRSPGGRRDARLWRAPWSFVPP